MSINYSARIIEDNQFRFWVSLFTFPVCVLLSYDAPLSSLLWITLLFLVYAALFGLAHLTAKRTYVRPFLQYALLAFDTIVVTMAIYFTGGLKSPLYILYVVLFGLCIYHESLSNFVYTSVLSFLLYSGLVLYDGILTQSYWLSFGGQLLVMGILTGVLYAILVRSARQSRANQKLMSRAGTLAHISNVLSGSLSSSRDWVKKITTLIEGEIRGDDLKCRIAIHKGNQPYLPPSSGQAGIQIPIMVGELIFGTLMVTRKTRKPLSHADQDFFSSIARSLGLSLHRARLWEDFQNQLKKVEANLLLNSKPQAGPPNSWINAEGDFHTVDGMIDIVRGERGTWDLNREVESIDFIISSIIRDLKKKPNTQDINLRVVGPVHAIQPFMADWKKIKKVMESMFEEILFSNSQTKEIILYLNQIDHESLILSMKDSQDKKASLSNSVESFYGTPFTESAVNEEKANVRLLFCKKVIEAHGGRFWIEESEKGEVLSFQIPFKGKKKEPKEISQKR